MARSNTLSVATRISDGTATTPADNKAEPDENILEEQRDCFDARHYLAALGPSLKGSDAPDIKEQQETPPLKAGEVYSLLDFCSHRAPAWYRSEVSRMQQLFETNTKPAVNGSSSILDIWESSHAAHADQQRNPPASTAEDTPSLIITIKTSPPPSLRKTPTRVQPHRNAKRKAAEMEDSKPRVTIKRRRKTRRTGGGDAGRTASTYYISKPVLSQALHHPSLPPTTEEGLHGQVCHRGYNSFLNGLAAEVTAKMAGMYRSRAAAAAEKPKPRRCALQGRETAEPWCVTGGRQAADVFQAEAVVAEAGPAVPEAEMLASPSCANWPPRPVRTRIRTRMPKEDGEEGAVEFGGLKFLLDVCGEPPEPRVMML